MKIRTYSQLLILPTYEERFEYLKLTGEVGIDTFGFDRIFNQMFYRSKEWKDIRRKVILRDMGCDLGIDTKPIFGKIIVHHMNPISLADIQNATDYLLNQDYLICTSHETHNAIHYSTDVPTIDAVLERTPNDTCPWKR